MTGWKNSSITFWVLESSAGLLGSAEAASSLAWLLTPELLADGACLLDCLLCWPLGVLNSLQVKTIANASPAMAPKDRESCSSLIKVKYQLIEHNFSIFSSELSCSTIKDCKQQSIKKGPVRPKVNIQKPEAAPFPNVCNRPFKTNDIVRWYLVIYICLNVCLVLCFFPLIVTLLSWLIL